MSRVISMVTTMLKIGFIGFGGGTALIPVMEDEMVEKSHLVTEEQFNNEVVIASMTPGALPVEIATGIGRMAAGNRGMLAASTAMAFPGALLTVLFLMFLSGVDSTIQVQIRYLAAGISAFIILTLGLYVTGTMKQPEKKKEKFLYGFIILAVFLLSGEKNVYQLLEISATPIFAISTIQILGTAFFVILFTKGELRNVKRTAVALLIAGGYFLCIGQTHLLPEKMKPWFLYIMIVLALIGTVQAIRESENKNVFPAGSSVKSLLCWFFFLLVFSLPALCLSTDFLHLIGKGFLSSVMSFGGGDAYLSVAQGLFVDSGDVSYQEFYGNIVSIANALPGSILCKVLTGISYVMGYQKNNSILEGCLVALCGFACSVAASGSIVVLVHTLCEKYGNLRIFAVIKHFIRPIISGLLLNVALSLYLSGIAVQAGPGLTPGTLMVMTLVIILFDLWLIKKKNVLLIWKIILSAGISFIVCNVLV